MDYAPLIVGLLIFLLLGCLVWAAYRLGGANLQKDQAQSDAKVKDAQAQVAVNRPDKPSVVNKLRSGKF